SKSDLIVPFVSGHQRPTRRGIRLTRDRRGARFSGNTLVAEVTRDHRLANEAHSDEQKLNHGVARPCGKRLRPIRSGAGIGKIRQDRRDRDAVPRLGIESGYPDGALGIELLRGSLLSALADPTEQHRAQDPAPFSIAEPTNRCEWRNEAVHLDDPTRGREGRGSRIALPRVLEGGQRDLSDRIANFFHRAQSGRSTGAAGMEGGGAVPPPSNGGGCSTGCHSFL